MFSSKQRKIANIATAKEVAVGQESSLHESLPGTRHPTAVAHTVIFSVDLPVGVWIVVFVGDVASWFQNANVFSIRKNAAELRRGIRAGTVIWQVNACLSFRAQEFAAT